MFELVVFLLLPAVGALVWHSTLAAREAACRYAATLCQRVGLQLLDETVSLSRLRARRNGRGGWYVERHYRFDLSSNGSDRLSGEVRMRGDRMTGYTLPGFVEPGDSVDAGASARVVALPRREPDKTI